MCNICILFHGEPDIRPETEEEILDEGHGSGSIEILEESAWDHGLSGYRFEREQREGQFIGDDDWRPQSQGWSGHRIIMPV